MAAISNKNNRPGSGPALALISAALAIPGMSPVSQAGQTDTRKMSLQYLHYNESDDRMKAASPVLWMLAPVGETMDLELNVTLDTLSGASPSIVTNQTGTPTHILSSASITERRRELDLKLTRYFDKLEVGLNTFYSDEHDYTSKAVNLDARWLLDKKNTTISIGAGYTSDDISSSNDPGFNAESNTKKLFAGVTRVINPTTILQSNLSYTWSGGYLSDPYKSTINFISGARFPQIFSDIRPDKRIQRAWLTRLRKHLPEQDASVHLDYRYYTDSWGINAHTIEAAWYQSLKNNWSIRPSIRYYSQSDADFYFDAYGTSISQPYVSSDYRLARFGAITFGIKVSKKLSDETEISLSTDFYRQKNSLYHNGDGNSIAPVKASIIILGFTAVF